MWCGVVWCGVVWCGQVPRPHALKVLRNKPTRPPMSYVSPLLQMCVCGFPEDVGSVLRRLQTSRGRNVGSTDMDGGTL